MAARPGHHRPLGTTTWMRFPAWPKGLGPPLLGEVIAQTPGPGGDPDTLQRAYRIVGIEETRPQLTRAPGGYRVLAERIEYVTGEAVWTFFNSPRR